ncbi:MAG: ATP-binding protein [Chloroflexi bacterium]|nr:ATP-binding protein [Chloroflexota bacterium]
MNIQTQSLPHRAGLAELTDPEGLRHAATISVWVRWSILAIALTLLVYRPEYTLPIHVCYVLLALLAMSFNGYVHFLVRTGRNVNWQSLLALSALDVVLITGGAVVGGGLAPLCFLLYYPALALFAVAFASFRISLGWVTMAAVLYSVAVLMAGEGIDLGAKEEKVLVARIAAMYGVVVVVSLIARFEHVRRTIAVQRERELHRERIELSQAIHDRVAQSAYMIGLGIESAIGTVDPANEEQVARLEATHQLSRASMWELRHPIDSGLIFEGRELGEVLAAHSRAFTAITSVPADLVQSGKEPDLPAVTRGLLFSIAHNAMTNAMRHASANRVTVLLDFGRESLRMSISDDGVGLPSGYEDRGHGFRNMRRDAERIGGKLDVRSDGPGAGTTVTCVVPYGTHPEYTHRGGG